jgi:hypothetical protein
MNLLTEKADELSLALAIRSARIVRWDGARMIARRFLAYFILVTAFALAVTVVFEVYSLTQLASTHREQDQNFAESVARFVQSVIEQEAKRLSDFLSGMPADLKPGDRDAMAGRLALARKASLDQGGVALVDSKGAIIAADLDRDGPPPQKLLEDVIERAQLGATYVVSDFWRTKANSPHIALVVSNGGRQPFRAALLAPRLDGKRSVSTTCHSCHEERDAGRVREMEHLTMAPVKGTSRAVTVRESGVKRYVQLRNIGLSSAGLVAVILGAFVAFFVLLWRRVLKPMGHLVGALADLGQGKTSLGADLAGAAGHPDEFASLVRSVEARPRNREHATWGPTSLHR